MFKECCLFCCLITSVIKRYTCYIYKYIFFKLKSSFQEAIEPPLLNLQHFCQVFDRLQPIGVCIGYERSLKIMENLGGMYKDQLIEEKTKTPNNPHRGRQYQLDSWCAWSNTRQQRPYAACLRISRNCTKYKVWSSIKHISTARLLYDTNTGIFTTARRQWNFN